MNKQQRQQLLDELATLLGHERDGIVAEVQRAVEAHIASKSNAECLSLVLRDTDGTITRHLPLAASHEYATALIAFVRGKPLDDGILDSALTDSTAETVADVFSRLIGDKADAIAERLMPLVVSDARFASALSDAIMSAYQNPIPNLVKQKASEILSSKLSLYISHSIDTTTSMTIKSSLAKIAMGSVGAPVAAKIVTALVASLMVTLKPIIIKLLASAAFKAAVVSKLKAIVVGALLGAFVKIVGTKLGLTAAGAFIWVLIPLVLAWVAYEVAGFSAKLADKVSQSVAQDMRENFAETTRMISEELAERAIKEGIGLIAKNIIHEDAIVKIIEEAIADAD
ncbi:MAG: hypothetical protein Q8O26_17540 [Phreatobacter sp.]|uniref:hypothetical protein n=1 Tax=Phreatobacter sp. TaxID=1966341 RepID=UPI00273758E7|nr:hypothetical protein [Phreatobacter sp.]MDP2803676.1 hypothetical protein [Phreatobacter sp.]